MFEARVQNQALDPERELRAWREQSGSGPGALVSFVGLLRDWNAGREVREMFLEHYPGMTEKVLRQLLDEARARWPLHSALVLHRVGRLWPSDPIVLVAVGSTHRGEAFRACEFLIDALKTQTPLWKREVTDQGVHWVGAREMAGTTVAENG